MSVSSKLLSRNLRLAAPNAPFRTALCALLLLSLTTLPMSAQSTINVPADQTSIQAAIDLALPGDTVLVAPGTYDENIDFRGKDITVRSSDGRQSTTIDGGGRDPVVLFVTGESRDALLEGFTLRNGNGGNQGGGGIRIRNASPTIRDNHITENLSCTSGGGIYSSFSSPRIEGNSVSLNTQSPGCSGGSGGGLYIVGNSSAEVVSNNISENSWRTGGGISLFAAGTPRIENNWFFFNSADSKGGAIDIVNVSDALILQNVFHANTANQGGGVSWLVPFGARGPRLVSNTMVANRAPEGSAVYADGFDSDAELVNNILVSVDNEPALHCGTFNAATPQLRNNNVWNTAGPSYSGDCTDQTGLNGNISADPQFQNPAFFDYTLQATSPSVDTGDSLDPDLASLDLAGEDRIQDGNGDGNAVVDHGVYELPAPAPVLPTPADAFCSAATATTNNVVVRRSGTIDGGARSVANVVIRDFGRIFGTISANDTSAGYTGLALPAGVTDLGNLTLSGTDTLQLPAGEVSASRLIVRDTAEVSVAGTVANPTILYLTGPLNVRDLARLNANGDAAALLIVQTSDRSVNFRHTSTSAAAVYAPNSVAGVRDFAILRGALVGSKVVVNGDDAILGHEPEATCEP